MVEIRDVTDSQSQYLYLTEFLIRWQGGQQLSQLGERYVKRLHAHALPGRMRSTVFTRSSASSSSFFSGSSVNYYKIIFILNHSFFSNFVTLSTDLMKYLI